MTKAKPQLSVIKSLPVTIPLLVGQRPLKQTHLNKMIKDGFQASLWRRPSVVRVPLANLTAAEKKAYAAGVVKGDPLHTHILWDGQHRLGLWKATYGSEPIECEVTEASKPSTANRLFVAVQGSKAKALNNKEKFVNDVLANDTDGKAARTLDDLHSKLGVCVVTKAQGGRGTAPLNVLPVGATSDNYDVSHTFVDNIRSAISKTKRTTGNMTAHDAMLKAIELFKLAFPSKNYDKLPGALWGGLSILLYLREDLLTAHHRDNLIKFLEAQKVASSKLSRLVTTAKTMGGNALNRNEAACAHGLALMMKDSFNGNKDLYDRSAQTVKLLDIKTLIAEIN